MFLIGSQPVLLELESDHWLVTLTLFARKDVGRPPLGRCRWGLERLAADDVAPHHLVHLSRRGHHILALPSAPNPWPAALT